MRSEAEIENEMLSLGRPSMAVFDCGNLKALSALAQRQREWAVADPAKEARFQELLVEANAVAAIATVERKRAAEVQRALTEVRRIVGSRIADVLANPSETQSLRDARIWDAGSGWCLTMLGGVGAGKSVAAGWLAHQALARGDGVCWLRATEAATASLYGPEAQQRAQWARGARLLVIDDLGAEMASDAWKSWLEDVLCARHANAGRTALTSNLNAAGLKSRLSSRIVDRLREGVVAGSDAPSMRGQR